MSFTQAFPALDIYSSNALHYLQSIELVNTLMLLGVVIILYTIVWKVLMYAADFLPSVFLPRFSFAAVLNPTLGAWILCTMILGVIDFPSDDIVVIVAAAYTMYVIQVRDAYETALPTGPDDDTSSASLLLKLSLVLAWTAACIICVLDLVPMALFPLLPWVERGLESVDLVPWLGVFLRFLGVFACIQAVFRGMFASLAVFEYCTGRLRGRNAKLRRD